MSVWDAIVGQRQVVEQLKSVAAGDPASIAQSWLICGPPGSGRSNVARAFAAALESPDHGLDDVPTRTTEQILAGTHPDVTVLATNKVTIGIDEVRGLIAKSEQMPSTAPWRVIIIEDVDRMLERSTNVPAQGDRGTQRAYDLAAVRAQRPGRAADDPLAHPHREPGRAVHAGGGRVPAAP